MRVMGVGGDAAGRVAQWLARPENADRVGERLVEVGEATAPRLLLTGEAVPARHRYVAAAVETGRIGRDAAVAIIHLLDSLDDRVAFDVLDEAERTLVEQAVGLDLLLLRKVLLRAEAHLDPDGVEPKEEDLRARTFLSVRQESTGAIAVKGLFDPARKRVLPAFPRRLAVITSPSGAAVAIRPGKVDRSPTGTALSARMAVLGARGQMEQAFAVMNALRLVDISNNLGDAKSLITHPATTTHRAMGPEGRAAIGLGDGVVRISVGLEGTEDLLAEVPAPLFVSH